MTTVLESLNHALYQALSKDEHVILIGEDILSPYGGAFKVTKGLSDTFPGRVLTTPISEAALVGVGTGMALRGLRPVVEIMFGDFITLIGDQIINHAVKFNWMYNHQVEVPLVIRTPMGGRRGYGPTHSQSLEKLYLGMPGLRTLSPNFIGDPGRILLDVILKGHQPVLFVENKLLYNLPTVWEALKKEFSIQEEHPQNADTYSPTYILTIQGAPEPNLTIACYGYMAELTRQAMLELAYQYEIFVEMIIPSQLSPFEFPEIRRSTERTKNLLIVEEGNLTLGWGAEVAARTVESLGSQVQSIRRLASEDSPIPASGPLESRVLPSVDSIIKAARSMI
jgi:pyruvate/2-oxoglutarate/acetoin dehydrogenase E1 component